MDELNHSNFITGKVIDMKSIFNGCSSLSMQNLSAFDTTNARNMDRMFYDCLSIK